MTLLPLKTASQNLLISSKKNFIRHINFNLKNKSLFSFLMFFKKRWQANEIRDCGWNTKTLLPTIFLPKLINFCPMKQTKNLKKSAVRQLGLKNNVYLLK